MPTNALFLYGTRECVNLFLQKNLIDTSLFPVAINKSLATVESFVYVPVQEAST